MHVLSLQESRKQSENGVKSQEKVHTMHHYKVIVGPGKTVKEKELENSGVEMTEALFREHNLYAISDFL